MLRWYWYLCGSVYAKQTRLLQVHQDEDYERDADMQRALADHWNRPPARQEAKPTPTARVARVRPR